MPRTAGSHAQITGPRVRRVAERLFARQGYAAVSMREIAAEVGVQAGALYNYTPNKQTLLFELMHEHMTELLATWDTLCGSAQARQDTLVQRLHRFCDFHIGHHLERPDAVFIAYMELRNLSGSNYARIEELRGAYESRLEKILEAGKAAGVFTLADPKISTWAVIAMLTGVNTWFRPDGRLGRDEVKAIYWGMVRRSLHAPEE